MGHGGPYNPKLGLLAYVHMQLANSRMWKGQNRHYVPQIPGRTIVRFRIECTTATAFLLDGVV